jgi:serine-type D-Ala-D-Ala carboxypeptidase/endopeptidase (penicillin-binding protein 4)
VCSSDLSAKGISVIRNTLTEAGLTEETGMLNCGSGLSRFCRISPETFCRLLTAAWRDPIIGADFTSSLAVNAEQGTLRRRMHKPGLTVRGKTGTLNDVIGFAGYVSGPSGKTYAVTIMLNDVKDRAKARQAIDSFLEEVAFSN